MLPFDNVSAAPDRDYFSDGLTEEIISRLSSVEGLKVISRTSAMHYKDTHKPMREIAKELNVAHVLEGSVRYVNDRVHITAVLIDAATDEKLWANDYEFEPDDVFRAQEEIARAVAKALEVKLGRATAARITWRGTDDPTAYEFYQRGRWLWTQRTPQSYGYNSTDRPHNIVVSAYQSFPYDIQFSIIARYLIRPETRRI